MIKKDLERVGIPYRTEEGTADFHAVGRHTHITELLRNGASLVEARELARHSDIRMTMRYTHIGLDDQARAVAAIPAPRTPQPHQREEESWEHIGSKTCGKPCHLPSSAGNRVTMELATVNDENPCGDRGLDAVCQPLALDGTKDKKWGRRESNACPHFPIDVTGQGLTRSEETVSALCLYGGDNDCLCLTQIDPRLRTLIDCWGALPESVRQEVEALCLEPAS